jgi:4-nitrophenyl phosphatase
MKKCGHLRVEQGKADFIVVGLDRTVTYDKLDHAARLAREGAGIVATHTSALYMYKDGPAMAAGPLVKAIEYAASRRATVIGKPSTLMFRTALKKAGCDRKDAVMIGDQLDTDIAGANRSGIDAVLVTSGVDQDAGGYRLLAKLPDVDAIIPLL